MKTQLTDTHTHIYAEQFDEDRDTVIQSAIDQGIDRLFMPNIDSGSIEAMLAVAKKFPDNCFPMMGVHPCSVTENWKEELEIARKYLFDQKDIDFCAVGEIGLDYYWDTSFKAIQKEAFREQIKWAKQLKLPIVIHVRDSFDDAIEIVEAINDENLSGVFHCFSGTKAEAERIIALEGFYIGLGGVLTFKNSKLREEIKDISLEHIVLETDSPYLAPSPHRGKRNESAYVALVAEKLAEVKELDIATIAEFTNRNSKHLFNK
ncbi:MAG: TatD family hydrolase [Chitinophagales bacterium]